MKKCFAPFAVIVILATSPGYATHSIGNIEPSVVSNSVSNLTGADENSTQLPDYNIYVSQTEMRGIRRVSPTRSRGTTVGVEKNFTNNIFAGLNYALLSIYDSNFDGDFGFTGEKADSWSGYVGFAPIRIAYESVIFSTSILLGMSNMSFPGSGTRNDAFYGYIMDFNFFNKIGLRWNSNLGRNEFDSISSLGLIGYF